ncbi:RICIN domain-containing protein [Aquimarina addita]
MKNLTVILFFSLFFIESNAQNYNSSHYVNGMDYVLGDVKQAFIQNRITTQAQADNLLKGFREMKVNGIRIPIFPEGAIPNKAMLTYFYNQAVAQGFPIMANPAQSSGAKNIACEGFGIDCNTRGVAARTNILIDHVKEFASEYKCKWINPFNEDGRTTHGWNASQMNTIYSSLYGNVNGAEIIGSGAWGIPASIEVMRNTNISNYITVATTHNLGYDHGSWATFIDVARAKNLPVWDSEVNHNITEAANRNTTTRLVEAINRGVDGLVLYNSWKSINLTNGSINAAGQAVMDLFLVETAEIRTDKKYYIDCIGVNKRLAADGESEDPYGTTTTTTGANVEWIFVPKGNGYYHIRRAAGGTKPGLRTVSNTALADMQATTSSGEQTYYVLTPGSAAGSYHITLPDWQWGDGRKRLQMNRANQVLFTTTASSGSWVSFKLTEAGNYSSTGSNVVHITKRNSTGFAMDGQSGASERQNIYLWNADVSNGNQQWIEINRGNGYYAYQKQGTDYCIDGNNGGANQQNVYLWPCDTENPNQHWQKVDAGGGAYKLVKRNTNYALNGGSGGAREQNVNLYNASSNSQNLHWFVTPLDTSAKSLETIDGKSIVMYPNPVNISATIKNASNSILTIYDIKGSAVFTKPITSESESIDLSKLTAGMYYGKVSTTRNNVIIKFIKN